MKIYGHRGIITTASNEDSEAILTALQKGAMETFSYGYCAPAAMLVPEEGLDVRTLTPMLEALQCTLAPWSDETPEDADPEETEAYAILCHAAYEPLLEGYAIYVGVETNTNTYDLYEDGSVSHHMQCSWYETMDIDRYSHHQLFASEGEAKDYILYGDYKDFKVEEVDDLPYVCYNSGTFHTKNEDEQYHTYIFKKYRYDLRSNDWYEVNEYKDIPASELKTPKAII